MCSSWSYWHQNRSISEKHDPVVHGDVWSNFIPVVGWKVQSCKVWASKLLRLTLLWVGIARTEGSEKVTWLYLVLSDGWKHCRKVFLAERFPDSVVLQFCDKDVGQEGILIWSVLTGTQSEIASRVHLFFFLQVKYGRTLIQNLLKVVFFFFKD